MALSASSKRVRRARYQQADTVAADRLLRPLARLRSSPRPWWTTGLLTKSGLKSLILPAITLSLFPMTLIMRLARAEMLKVLRTDYIKVARARGLTDRAIHFGHALKNTLASVITITGLQLGAIIAFAIITETVFQWPGMGLLFIQAVNFADIPTRFADIV